SACAPLGGPVPVLSAFGGAPVAGNSSFGLVVSNAPAGVAGLLLIGGSTTNWAGVPLPIPLGSLGLPGCALQVAPGAILPFVTSNASDQVGAARIPLPVPPAPALSGIFVAAQAFVNDPVRLALGSATRAFAITLP